MNPALSIASTTFREARRNKVFYSIFFFAVAFILSSFIFTNLTIAAFDRVLRDVGTGAIDFFGALLAIFLGIGLVSREVDRKTVYTVVTKPIRRWQFIVGKFLGLFLVLLVSLGVMFVSLLVVLYTASTVRPSLSPLLWYFVLALTQLSVVVAFAILMSTFTGSALSAFATVGLYLIGHFSPDLYYFGQKVHSAAVKWLTSAIYYVVPNLDRFSLAHQITYDQQVKTHAAALTILYGLLYTGAFLMAAVVAFERRDFK